MTIVVICKGHFVIVKTSFSSGIVRIDKLTTGNYYRFFEAFNFIFLIFQNIFLHYCLKNR